MGLPPRLGNLGLCVLALPSVLGLYSACTGEALSLGNAMSILSEADVATLSTAVGTCSSGFEHPNVCCTVTACGAYAMSPFAPCPADAGFVLYPNPRSCCSLDNPALCLDAGTAAPAPSCFYTCAPNAITDPAACEISEPSVTCNVPACADAGCPAETCDSAPSCSCPGTAHPATSTGLVADAGSSVCCQDGDAGQECFSVAVGSAGSGSGGSSVIGTSEAGAPADATSVSIPISDGGLVSNPVDAVSVPIDAGAPTNG